MKVLPIEIENFRTITHKLEDLVITANCSYMDAAIDLCEKNGLEVEFIGELISSNATLKAKFQIEAEGLNFLKKE
jgi:hypothetical protein